MVRTIITPEQTDIHLTVPENYIGKEIEVLFYAREEVKEEPTIPKANTMSRFKGLLTKEEGEELQEYVKKSREEWQNS